MKVVRSNNDCHQDSNLHTLQNSIYYEIFCIVCALTNYVLYKCDTSEPSHYLYMYIIFIIFNNIINLLLSDMRELGYMQKSILQVWMSKAINY